MKPLLIIKTGSKLPSLAEIPGDYEDWIAAGMNGSSADVITLDAATSPSYPKPDEVAGIVITGSGAMVTDADPWMAHGAAWLAAAVRARRPTLGICFGHQWLAHALGGAVNDNPRGVEVGTATLHTFPAAQTDPLFAALPESFQAQVSHRQSVLTLPPGAELLARSTQEPHHAFRWGPTAWGIQFHPEFSATVIPHFIRYYEGLLGKQGVDASALLNAVTGTPESAKLLATFADIVHAQGESNPVPTNPRDS